MRLEFEGRSFGTRGAGPVLAVGAFWGAPADAEVDCCLAVGLGWGRLG